MPTTQHSTTGTYIDTSILQGQTPLQVLRSLRRIAALSDTQAQMMRVAVHMAHQAQLEARLGKRVEFTCTRCSRHVIAYGKATGCGRKLHIQPTQ